MNTDARELILRLARVDASSAWEDNVNPAQRAILRYLAIANRFSRSPSHVAEYLRTSRGTMSQSLKSLLKKGLVIETRSSADKRVISYDLTPEGARLSLQSSDLEHALDQMSAEDLEDLGGLLRTLTRAVFTEYGVKEYGPCNTCRHHESRGRAGYCTLLSVDITPQDITKICAEHSGDRT